MSNTEFCGTLHYAKGQHNWFTSTGSHMHHDVRSGSDKWLKQAEAEADDLLVVTRDAVASPRCSFCPSLLSWAKPVKDLQEDDMLTEQQ